LTSADPETWLEGHDSPLPGDFSEELIDAVERAWVALGEAYDRERLEDSRIAGVLERLAAFQTFDERRGFSLLDAWKISGEGLDVVVCVATRLVPEEEGIDRTIVAHRECRLMGLFELGRDVGQAVIRPETFRDTVLDIILRREVDFPESPDFCRRYYVLASSARRLREGLPRELLDLLGSHADLFIEISGLDMTVFWDAVIDAESAVEATGFFSRLSAIIAPQRWGPYR